MASAFRLPSVTICYGLQTVVTARILVVYSIVLVTAPTIGDRTPVWSLPMLGSCSVTWVCGVGTRSQLQNTIVCRNTCDGAQME